MSLENHSTEIKQKRYEKGNSHTEIKILNSLPNLKIFPRKAPFGVIIRIIFPPNHLSPAEVHFDLYLEGKYPFQSPKLVLESLSSFPSASDGRDLIDELLQVRWSPSITCADIVSKLPSFYQTSLLPSEKILFNINYGKFHLGSAYLLDVWHNKDSMGSFYCTENDMNNWKFVKQRMIVVTHTLILIFELNTEIIDVGYLISWATIQSLGSIKRAMSEPDRLTFEWKQIGENRAFSQQFKVQQAGEMIELISRNVKRIMRLSKSIEEKSVFKEEDVNGKAIKNMKIVEVLEEIEIIEKHLKGNLSLKIVENLMELYQHAIEYFTAVGDLQFQVYLKKMHELMLDEEVAMVLQGGIKESKVGSQEDRRESEKIEHESLSVMDKKMIGGTKEEKKSGELGVSEGIVKEEEKRSGEVSVKEGLVKKEEGVSECLVKEEVESKSSEDEEIIQDEKGSGEEGEIEKDEEKKEYEWVEIKSGEVEREETKLQKDN